MSKSMNEFGTTLLNFFNQIRKYSSFRRPDRRTELQKGANKRLVEDQESSGIESTESGRNTMEGKIGLVNYTFYVRIKFELRIKDNPQITLLF